MGGIPRDRVQGNRFASYSRLLMETSNIEHQEDSRNIIRTKGPGGYIPNNIPAIFLGFPKP